MPAQGLCHRRRLQEVWLEEQCDPLEPGAGLVLGIGVGLRELLAGVIIYPARGVPDVKKALRGIRVVSSIRMPPVVILHPPGLPALGAGKDTKCARSTHVCLAYIYIYVAPSFMYNMMFLF